MAKNTAAPGTPPEATDQTAEGQAPGTTPPADGQPPAADAAATTQEPTAPPPPDGQPPAENKKANGPARKRIRNTDYAGMTVGGMEGSGPAVFDADGIAEVDAANFAFFTQIPGYKAAE